MDRFPSIALAALLLCACRHAGPASGPARVRDAARPAATAPRAARAAPAVAGRVYDARDGSETSFDVLVDRLAQASHVYVGEEHDQARHHAFQARVLAALAARWEGRPVALGMEMFYVPFQPALDAYVAGEIDEREMLARTEWATRWGFGWETYAPMLRFCRAHKIPVVALNAPKEVTRTVARHGLEALSAEQRAALPPLDTTVSGHRDFVRRAFGAHGANMPAEAFERFYLSMVIWDEVMSSSVASWLAAHGPDSRMVVVAGDGHVADRWGVPDRAAKKSGRRYLSVVQYVVDPEGGGEGDEGSDGAGGGGADPRRSWAHADYAVWWPPSGPPASPPPASGAPVPRPTPAPARPPPRPGS